jgi:hypothetical protein
VNKESQSRREERKKTNLITITHRHHPSHGSPCSVRGALDPLVYDLREARGAHRGGSSLPCH